VAVAGVDLPIKLRNALGQGKVVPVEELARRLAPFDANQDGDITRQELATFFQKSRLGGPWFGQVVAKTLWGFVQTKLGKDVEAIKIELVAKIIHTVMRRGPRPEKRYEITPESMVGYAPMKEFEKRPKVLGPAPQLGGTSPQPTSQEAKPRATPRGDPVESARAMSQAPGRTGQPAAGGAQVRPAMRRPAPRRPGPRR
jgi:hypothetical protein